MTPFDPYQTWLDIPADVATSNLYKLLGLNDREADSKQIALAADRALARVRSQRPGAQAVAWQKLLDELNAAKARLADPAQKAKYDADLAPASGSKNTVETTAPSSPSWAWPPGMGPAETKSEPTATKSAAPTGNSTAQTPANPAAPSKLAADFLGQQRKSPTTELANKLAPDFDSEIPFVPEPDDLPPGAQGSLRATPSTASSAAASSGGSRFGGSFDDDAAELPPAAALPARAMPVGAASSVPSAAEVDIAIDPPAHPMRLVLALGSIAAILVIGLVTFMFLNRRQDPLDQPIAQSSATGPGIAETTQDNVPDQSTKPSPAARPSPEPKAAEDDVDEEEPAEDSGAMQDDPPLDDEEPVDEEPQDMEDLADSSPNDDAMPADGDMPEDGEMPDEQPGVDEVADVEDGMSEEAMTAEGDGAMDPADGESPTTPTADDPEQLAQLDGQLEAVRLALAERRLDEAKSLLDAARQDAVSPSAKTMVSQSEMLAESVDNFWAAVVESLKTINSGDEIKVGSTVASVVENTPEELTIHVAGRSKTYRIIDGLPSGVARMLAERWLDQSAATSKVFVGAFLIVDPKSEPGEARQLLDEAALGGVDTRPLLSFLPESP